VGPATYRRLIAEHGTARAALRALPEIAKATGLTDYEVCPARVVSLELKAGRKANARLVFDGDPDFPATLSDVKDAPVMLWAIGNLELTKRPMVALVGARNASSLGTRMAHKLAADLSDAGYVVVSGLARGIDATAHSAALEKGTIGVLAGGVDVLYPAENAELARNIGIQGLRLSDQPMGLHPQARHFVARNRIISGMSRATVVVEAAARSGSLITARTALDQGRDVLAVPGHPFDARVSGCNMLIRDGATLVRGIDDIIEHIGSPDDEGQPGLPMEEPEPTDQTSNLIPQDILALLGDQPMGEDQLIRSLRAAPTEFAALLMDLELDGQVVRNAGGLLARAQ